VDEAGQVAEVDDPVLADGRGGLADAGADHILPLDRAAGGHRGDDAEPVEALVVGVVDGAGGGHAGGGDDRIGPDVAFVPVVLLKFDGAVRVEGGERIVPVADVDDAVLVDGR
jgi:hypothetical protein